MFGGRVIKHIQFQTAKWTLPEDLANSTGLHHVDFVTARDETYAGPGELPDVVFATLREDLSRRDFSINACAISILPETFGDLADPLNGRVDLEIGSIRTLHAASFVDDGTRLFRAVRYEQRTHLGEIGPWS